MLRTATADVTPGPASERGRPTSGTPPGPDLSEVPRPWALDRVVRVVSLLFLAAAGVAVAVGGSSSASGVAVYLVLAVATLTVVFVADLVPQRLFRGYRPIIQAIVAIGVLTLLVALTGGVRSPFVAGYYLIVGGAALSSDDGAPTLLAITTSLAYLLVALILPDGAPGGAPLGRADLAYTIFNVVALGLLAYIATVSGRGQREAREAAMRLARFDGLTGLYTRTYLYSAIEREIARASRIGRGFCLLMLDLDDLKPVNDTFGHPVGDRLLRGITDVIRKGVRQTDLAARYGGDEFVVLLPETVGRGALIVAEKLRSDIASLVLRVDARQIRTSVSIGLVAHPEDGATTDDLMAAVDAAMYESKRRGKNQIVGYMTEGAGDAGDDEDEAQRASIDGRVAIDVEITDTTAPSG